MTLNKNIFLAILVVAIWGINTSISKIAVGEIPPMLFLGVRFLIVGLIYLPFAKFRKKEIKDLLATTFFLNIIHYVSIFYAMTFLSASTMSLLIKMEVPITLILASLLYNEKMTKAASFGVLLSFLGVLIIFGIPEINLFGFALAFIGCIGWAFGSFGMKRLKGINSASFMAFTGLVCSPVLLLASYAGEDITNINIDTINWTKLSFAMTYQVVAFSFAMALWQKLLAREPLSNIVPILILQPIFGIASGIIILDEKINYLLILGGAVIVTGLYITMKYNKKIKTHKLAKMKK